MKAGDIKTPHGRTYGEELAEAERQLAAACRRLRDVAPLATRVGIGAIVAGDLAAAMLVRSKRVALRVAPKRSRPPRSP